MTSLRPSVARSIELLPEGGFSRPSKFMNLVELTMVLAIGLAMVTAGLTQGNNQYEVIRTYKQVEYYSNDVPRMITAVQNVTRGAKSFWITPRDGAVMTPAGPIGRGTAMLSTGGNLSDHGQALLIHGVEKESGSTGEVKSVDRHTLIFLVERNDITQLGSDRYEDRTGAVDLLGNRYHLAVKSVKGQNISQMTSPGWYLIRNVADVRFDHVPGTDGVVLMRVYRQYRSGDAPVLAFEQVLERR